MFPQLLHWKGKSIVLRLLLSGVVLAILTCTAVVSAQRPAPPPTPDWGADPLQAPEGPTFDPRIAAMERRRILALNTERQKKLVADTRKLVKLAAELNAEINSKHQAQLTPEQLRTVAEIEKLARSVKNKMSTPVMGASRAYRFPSMIPRTIP